MQMEPASVAMQWVIYTTEARGEVDVQVRPGDGHSRTICRSWKSAGVAEWPVIAAARKSIVAQYTSRSGRSEARDRLYGRL